jgi:hypothetical protein
LHGAKKNAMLDDGPDKIGPKLRVILRFGSIFVGGKEHRSAFFKNRD